VGTLYLLVPTHILYLLLLHFSHLYVDLSIAYMLVLNIDYMLLFLMDLDNICKTHIFLMDLDNIDYMLLFLIGAEGLW
jgi:hypothetical protein